jgi:hypothetical protein
VKMEMERPLTVLIMTINYEVLLSIELYFVLNYAFIYLTLGQMKLISNGSSTLVLVTRLEAAPPL